MSKIPGWKELPKYPVIVGVGLLAIAATTAWWCGIDVSAFFETAEIRRGQMWRLITSILLHLDILHLAFNLYWLWVLGTTVERVFGHFRTVLIILLFAVGSNCFDFAFASGGVGLSGVGYGLFGMLYVLSHYDERLKDALDDRTMKLFVGWFFICIFTTFTHIFSVANVAHGAGAVLGMLLGYAIALPKRRVLFAGNIIALLGLGLCGATFARPVINLSGQGGYEEGQWGYRALLANQNQEAVRWLCDAVKYQPKVSSFWFNLGIAYQRLNNHGAAFEAYQRAYELEPTAPGYAEAAGKKTEAN